MIKNKLIILVGKDGRPSMKGVYSKMNNDSELHVRRNIIKRKGVLEYFRKYTGHNVNKLEKVSIKENDLTNKIIVRWGNTIVVDTTNSIVYNKAEAVSNASNKKLSREIFEQKGLNCPKLIKNQEDASKALKFGPIIARPSRHSKGKNFILISSLAEYNAHVNNHNDWYYSQFVNKKQEFRVHVAHGRILNYLEKPNPGDNQIAWNRAVNGEAFDNVKWDNYNKNICELAIKAITALGLDFGGVDIMLDAQGNACLLEVNTAATLASSEYSMSRYAMYFDWLCKTNQRREHFELKDFNKSSNYAWHDYHFADREPNKLK